jgi:hypothetical protein
MKPNKCIEFAPVGRPTRKGDAPLLAAHARRWASRRVATLAERRRLTRRGMEAAAKASVVFHVRVCGAHSLGTPCTTLHML